MKVKPKPVRLRKHLTYPEIGLAIKLRDEGLTQEQIAQRLDRDQTTISDVLLNFTDTRPIAQLKLRNSAVRFAERVIQRADVDQSLEMLDRLEVVPRRQVDHSKANQVNIVIGMPGKPVGPDLSPSVTVDLHRITDDNSSI